MRLKGKNKYLLAGAVGVVAIATMRYWRPAVERWLHKFHAYQTVTTVNPQNYLSDPEAATTGGTGTLGTVNGVPVDIPYTQGLVQPGFSSQFGFPGFIGGSYGGFPIGGAYGGGPFGGNLGYNPYLVGYGGSGGLGFTEYGLLGGSTGSQVGGYGTVSPFGGYNPLLSTGGTGSGGININPYLLSSGLTGGTYGGLGYGQIGNPYQAYGWGALNNPVLPPEPTPVTQYGMSGNPFGFGKTIQASTASDPPMVSGPGIPNVGQSGGAGSYIGYLARANMARGHGGHGYGGHGGHYGGHGYGHFGHFDRFRDFDDPFFFGEPFGPFGNPLLEEELAAQEYSPLMMYGLQARDEGFARGGGGGHGGGGHGGGGGHFGGGRGGGRFGGDRGGGRFGGRGFDRDRFGRGRGFDRDRFGGPFFGGIPFGGGGDDICLEFPELCEGGGIPFGGPEFGRFGRGHFDRDHDRGGHGGGGHRGRGWGWADAYQAGFKGGGGGGGSHPAAGGGGGHVGGGGSHGSSGEHAGGGSGGGRAGGKVSRTPSSGHVGGGNHPNSIMGRHGGDTVGRGAGGVHPTGELRGVGDDRLRGHDLIGDRYGRDYDRDYDRGRYYDYDPYYIGGVYDPCLDPLYAEEHPRRCGLFLGLSARANQARALLPHEGLHELRLRDPLRYAPDRFHVLGDRVYDRIMAKYLPFRMSEYQRLLAERPGEICRLYPYLCLSRAEYPLLPLQQPLLAPPPISLLSPEIATLYPPELPLELPIGRSSIHPVAPEEHPHYDHDYDKGQYQHQHYHQGGGGGGGGGPNAGPGGHGGGPGGASGGPGGNPGQSRGGGRQNFGTGNFPSRGQ